MCEMFGMSSRKPTAVTYSLDEFSRNGSKLRHNRDGWGIAFARDREAFLVKEPQPANESAWVKFIAEQSIRSIQDSPSLLSALDESLDCLASTTQLWRATGNRRFSELS